MSYYARFDSEKAIPVTVNQTDVLKRNYSWVGILYASICLLLPLISIIIGSVYLHDKCQDSDDEKKDIFDTKLAPWLIGYGIICYVCYFMMIMSASAENAAAFVAGIISVLLYYIIGTILWGIVLFKYNSECLESGNPLGILSLIILVFPCLTVLLTCIGVCCFKACK